MAAQTKKSIRNKVGFGPTGYSPAIVNTTASSYALTNTLNAGKILTIDLAGGTAVTLPAATGTGDTYVVIIGTTLTSSGTISAASAADSFTGFAIGIDTDVEGATGYTWNADAADDRVTMEGVARGGVAGDRWTFTDYATGLWNVAGSITQSGGSEVTPFSAAV